MKNKNNDRERLEHILKAIDFILNYTKDKTEDDFYREDLLKYAVLKQIEIIGEAANYLSKGIIEKYNEIEWRDIINARHIYVHHYDRVDFTMVWEIVVRNIPKLKTAIENILTEI